MLLDLMGTFAIRRRFAEVAGEKEESSVKEYDDDEVIAMVLIQAAQFYYWGN
jgi:hypothetical protein